jgi:hypothetical protein
MGSATKSFVRGAGLLTLLSVLLVAGCFDWQGDRREQDEAGVSAPDGALPRPEVAKSDGGPSAVPPASPASPGSPASPASPVTPASPSPLVDAAVAQPDATPEVPKCVVGVALLDRCRLR